MNKIYRVIWNKQLACWQAVSELAKSHSSTTQKAAASETESSVCHSLSSVSSWMRSILFFSVAVLPLSIHAAISTTELPTGAQINSGSASFNQTSNTLNINQNSQNLSTYWNTFNIGQDATVNFNQPNQSSTAINHVLDSNASQIMGRLNANGQVFLLNPNGVVFSKTAQVNVGGLVASTLNLSDADIQNGKYTLKGDANSTASIENQGSIQTLQGGTVALIAPNVKNTGTISTPNGTTHLTSASQVTLALQDGSLTQYQVDQGVLQGLVDNGGAIIADNGAVYLTAKAKDSLSKAVVNHSGIIEANRLSQNAKGEIILLGDMQSGETHVSGTLKAEGKNGVDGGFIETSAAHVEIAADTKVSMASDTGKSGLWLIDPVDITIDTAKATAIQTALNSGDVTVTTANSASNSWGVNGTGTAKGDIHVNSAISWSSNQALTLRADNDININADITATGATGKLNLKYGQTTSNTHANYYLNNGAKVNLKAGDNFSTQKGTEAVKEYKVITALGVAGSTIGTDLQGINGNLSGNYVLGADIDASGTWEWNGYTGFDPIGSYNTNLSPFDPSQQAFRGRFDGLGHAINGLTIESMYQGIGLFAITDQNALIQNVGLNNIYYSGYGNTGGLVGLNLGTINNVYVNGGTVTGNTDQYGGLVGWNFYTGKILNSYTNVIVKGKYSSNNNIGGLVGNNEGTIDSSFATGSVKGNKYIGGLVGTNASMGFPTSGKIVNSYATGAVVGNQYVAGLVGFNGGSVEKSYSSGNVTGNTFVGGLVGGGNGTTANSFWNTTTSGQTGSAGGTGKTTTELQQLSTFAGWDIDATGGTGRTWRIYEGQSTPLLRYLLKPVVSTTLLSTNFIDQMYNGLISSGGLLNPGFTYKTISKNVGTYSISDGSIIIMGDLAAQNMSQFGNDIIYKNIIGPSSFNIIPAPIAVSGIQANDKTYDGTTAATLNTSAVNLIGKIAGDNLALTGATGIFNDKNVGSNKAVTVNSYTLMGTDAGNYHLIYPTTGLAATISKANLAVTGLRANNKIYDATTAATVSGTASVIAFAGDVVAVAGTGPGSFADTNVGTNKAVTVSGYSLTGTDAGNYTLVQPTGLNANISKANLAVTGLSANNKIYDATTAATLSGTASVSAFAGDVVAVTGTGTGSFADKNVGTNKAVTVSGYSLTGADAGNYTLVQPAGLNANISKANLAVTGLSANNKIYDATTAATLSGTASVSAFAGDVVAVTGTGTGSFADKNVGTNKAVTVSGYSLTGADAGNYTLIQPTGLTASISKAVINAITGITANNKTYDGTTAATLNTGSAGFTGMVAGDNLTVATSTGNFIDKNAGTGKTVNITGLSLGGSDAGNYVLASTTAMTTADISKATIANVAGITANNRVYDGTKDAALTSGSAQFNGIVAGDHFTVATATGQFNDKNAGTGQTVNITGLSLGGSDAANYTLTSTSAMTTADISKATIANVAGITANNRVYDGTKDAALNSSSAQFNGIVAGDNLTVATATGQFNDKNAGTGKTVNITGLSLGGSDAGNYVLASNTASNTADITAKTLTAGLIAQNKVYDGNTSATASFTDNRIGTDDVQVNGTASFADKNVGTGKTVTSTGLTLSGADAGNYILAATTVTDTADIAKAKISQVSGITAHSRIYDATIQAALDTATAQFNGMVAGDQLIVATATGQFSDKNVGTAKQVSIINISLKGADAHNYELVNSTAQTTADISKAHINNITGITADNRTYNGLTAASLNSSAAEFNGMVAGDQLTVATASGQFDDALPGQGKTVRISGLSLGGTDAQNYHLLDSTALTTADISLLTPAAYLQAIQFKRPRYLPETNNALNTVNIELRQGGVNTSGIQTLAGEH
ncbi:filamentous hemagglutinin N-terminal domain-containing protein [Acinetobacter sp. C_4_1]|uniref:YDG domain-containing protein n=1 Tax=Acinetobacter sp. C_4_1 TaxID=2755321 RepID=UPI0021BAFCAE|nr:YDG domain-containing protein [Acinetobacter sp. C_4_1]MCT8100762.1 filamentous hemagglutinin N-terminal domain-containing protein [Acinetobacter sp. C_4_1]